MIQSPKPDPVPLHFNFQYRFHPAGQGIFASGTVLALSESGESPPFHWIFDCGSTAPTVLIPIVERYRDLILSGHLDLLCISHFDKDHVSGLGDLLKDLDVDTVVMPYWSPIERLIVAASVKNPGGEYIELLGNPVAFVLERARSIRRIVIVGGPGDVPSEAPVGDRPPILRDEGERGPHPYFRDSTWNIKFDDREHPIRNSLSEETIDFAKGLGVVLQAFGSQVMGVASCHIANADWEFLFHHKPIDPSLVNSIRDKINARVRSAGTITYLLSDAGHRKAILTAYKSLLPKGESVNSTSLCVYSGPVLDRLQDCWISNPSPLPVIGQFDRSFRRHSPPHRGPVSILYTGDADFKIRTNRLDLHDFLTPQRWANIAILQIPHHGSRNNWEIGSSGDFSHMDSVFCADETHRTFKHPHREVVLDLIHSGPLLANKSIGWSWQGGAVFAPENLNPPALHHSAGIF